MATLNEQIGLLNKQLQLSQQADKKKHILEEYELIRKPLSECSDSLKTMFDRSLLLRSLPEDAPSKMAFSKYLRDVAKIATIALQTFNARWLLEDHEARQGNDLSFAINSLNGLISSSKDEVEQCWKSWKESLETLVTLEDVLLESQKNIPGLEAIYKAFVKNRQEFRTLVAKFPKDVSEIKKLQELSNTLLQLKAKMQFDLPQEVAIFFKELDGFTRKVSLSTMTIDVFEWLRSHNLLDAYVVSRKGTPYGY